MVQAVLLFCSSSYSNGASQSQKKRLLAKAQSECMLGVTTKREPGLGDYHHGHEYVHHSSCHGGGNGGSSCSKDQASVVSSSSNVVSASGYQYVTTSSAGSLSTGQDQHIVYSGYVAFCLE